MYALISKLFQAFFLGMIRAYQIVISPIFSLIFGSSGNCRFDPTCSQYAKQAIEVHGPFKGVWLGFRRILRCHPWGKWGHDPVPPVRKKRGE